MKEVILIFARRDDIFNRLLAEHKKQSSENKVFIVVKPGEIYCQPGEFVYQINPKEKKDYDKLLTALKQSVGKVSHIIHLWNYESRNMDYVYHGDVKKFLASLKRNMSLGMQSIDFLTEAMARQKYAGRTCIYYWHHGSGINLQPQNLMIQNQYLCLSERQSQFMFYSISLREQLSDQHRAVRLILHELYLKKEKNPGIVQYDESDRRGPLKLYQADAAMAQVAIKSNGIYLMVNNEEDSGWTLALQMLSHYQCRVMVIGSGEITREKTLAADQVNKNSERLFYRQVPTADYEAVRSFLHGVREQFHRINGIIYHLNYSDDASCEHNISGVLMMDDCTAEIPLDFYMTAGAVTREVGYDCTESISDRFHFSRCFAALRNEFVAQGKRHGLCGDFQWNEQDLDQHTSLIDLFSRFVKMKHDRSSVEEINNVDLEDEAVKIKLLHKMEQGIKRLIAEILGMDEREINLDFSISLDSPDGLQFDSISLTRLAENIRIKYEVPLTPVIFFQYKSLSSLIHFLFKKYGAQFFEYYKWQIHDGDSHEKESPGAVMCEAAESDEVTTDRGAEGSHEELNDNAGKGQWEWLSETKADILTMDEEENAVAIIGASGVFPGSPDLERLWLNLETEKDLISEIPPERWDWRAYFGDPHQEINKTNIKWGGFIDDIDQFDPDFFGISHKEASVMDPQQRIFLEHVWRAIEDAGYKMSDLSGTKTAVLAGAGASEYYEMQKAHNHKIEELSSTGKSNSILANRISYLFNFTGPSESIDVACASSIVAIHKAAEYIRSGECELAVAGGVHLILTPDMHIAFNKGGILSKDGACRVFDKNADGYVRSEGAGVVLLKPLKQAAADHDHIYAIILGSAVNHGGRSNSMTAPSPNAQAQVLVKAYQKAGISPATVNYIEAHGTATSLGDSIEMMALERAWDSLTKDADYVPQKPYCGIGSVKANLGHAEEAAGMAGLFKVIMGMKYEMIPASIHFSELNPYIDTDSPALYVVDQTMKWERMRGKDGHLLPRRAGISAFGFGGVNTHLIVEEYKHKKVVDQNVFLVVLSAQTQSTLKKSAERLLNFLENCHSQDCAMADIAFTLQVGREEMSERLAIVVKKKEELISGLKQYLADAEVHNLYVGTVRSKKAQQVNKSEAEACVKGKEYHRIARLWAEGAAIDWKLIYDGAIPNRVSLPGYPFQKKSFWFTDFGTAQNKTAVEYPGDSCVFELIERQAEETPDRKAAVFENRVLTYSQLMDKVNELAAYLCHKGVKDESHVGIFLDRSLDMLVGVLAVLKAGGTYIPLDPIYPIDRIRYIIQDAGLSYILTQSYHIEKLPAFTGHLIILDQDQDQIEHEGRLAVDLLQQKSNAHKAEQIAYVIYTSGSTGQPKGVQIYHKSLTNFLCSMALLPGLDEHDYLLAVTTLCFDIAGLELYLPLIRGGCVEILPEPVTRDGLKLKEKIDQSPATMMQATPATWQMLLSAGFTGKKGFKILCGGEALSQELSDRLTDCCEEVFNLYGPTETTIWSTISRQKKGETVSIGYPIANTQIYILDEHQNPVRAGVPGELCIGGAGVAKGYVNKPDLTRERFIPDPFHEGQRLYRTGDQAYFNEKGELCFVGRIDNQIKLRGYRIELEEIENVIGMIPEIEKAVVTARQEKSGQTGLVVFYTLKQGISPIKRQVIIHVLKKRLPDYMIPSTYILLKTLPLSLNLKVDRKALSQMEIGEIMEQYGEDTQLRDLLETDLRQIAAQILVVTPEEIESDVNLGDYGFNSLLFTDFAVAIHERYKTSMTAVIFYQYTTILAVAGYLLAHSFDQVHKAYHSQPKQEIEINDKETQAMPVRDAESITTKDTEPVAIIGMYGRMPQSPDLNSFWENLIRNQNLVTEIPPERWDYKQYFGDPHKEGNKTNSKWGGFIYDVDCFDAAFFKISPREAEWMDPRQRLLIESVWKTFEDGGYKPEDFWGTKTGLFIGSISSDYWDVIKDSNAPADGYTLSGLANSILPNRISYLFNLTGPSEAIDTACSSSLTAVDRAVSALRNGDCETALAGGVNLILSPYIYLSLSKNGMLSPDGACKSFDQSANGYVRGEGVGTILLKPLNKAIKDRDHIYAVIKSTAVNHGGRSNSLTAPNPEAQSALLVEAYSKAGIDPSAITYIETHGTGTMLGDPIEIEALKTAFDALYETSGNMPPLKPHCGLGAVKTNIGHLEAAAGIAGLFKTVLAMQAGVIPANLNFKRLNPYIDLTDSYFYLPLENQRWERPVDASHHELPRCAGVSSFGFGGANAHIVIEEYMTKQEAASGEAVIIVISAKDEETLLAYAKLLHTYIEGIYNEQATLDEIAYTLQTGRNAMEERAAFVVDHLQGLKEKLAAFIQGTLEDAVYRGNDKHTRDILSHIFNDNAGGEYFKALVKGREWNQLARLWALGVKIDWKWLYPSLPPKRVPLPTYPFAKTRYWISGEKCERKAVSANTLSPFIDSNESNIYELCYKKRFSFDDLFIREHVVMENKIMPAVVYLEMAGMAGHLANQRAHVKRLNNLVWLRPLAVSDSGRDIYLKLYPKEDTVEFSFLSKDDDGETSIVHAQGKMEYGRGNADTDKEFMDEESIDIEAIRKRCPHVREQDEFYQQLNELGYHYGPAFQPISKLFYSETEALSLIELPLVCEESFHDFRLHPSIMEGVLQTLAGLLFKKEAGASNRAFLPFSLGGLEIIRPLTTVCYSHISMLDDRGSKPSHHTRYQITLTDQNGLVLVKLMDYSVRPVKDDAVDRIRHPFQRIASPVYYRPAFMQAELNGLTNHHGALLIFDDDEGLINQLRRKTEKENSSMIKRVRKGEGFRKVNDHLYEINPSVYRDHQKLAEVLKAEHFIPSGIIHRWSDKDFSYEADALNAQLVCGVYSVFYLCKSITEQKIKSEISIFYLYQSEGGSPQPLFTALKSMGRAVRAEYAKLNLKVIELKHDKRKAPYLSLEDVSTIVWSELSHTGSDDYIVYQDGKRFVERYEEVHPKVTGQPSLLRENGVYLITGGMGGLGAIFAEYLAKKWKARIVLVGRSESPDGLKEISNKIREWGGDAIYVKADIGRYEEVRLLADQVKQKFGRLNGIIHCAGEIRDALLPKKTMGDFQAVLNAKVFGTINLDEVFWQEALDFFCVFSSVSSVLGTMGQTDYAFANGFMDSFSSYRDSLFQNQMRSGKTLALNWSFWRDGGMGITDAVSQFITHYYGIVPLESDTGLLAFETALSSDYNQLLVLEEDSDKIKQHLSGRGKTSVREAAAQKTSAFGMAVSQEELISQLREDVLKLISGILKLERDKLDVNKDIGDYGFDSISYTELTNQMNEFYECDLTPAVFFELEVPTIASFINLLHDKYHTHLEHYYSKGIQKEEKSGRAVMFTAAEDEFGRPFTAWESNQAEEAVHTGGHDSDRPVAIIGISGVMPQSEDLNEFWTHLAQSDDLITEVPDDRFAWRDYYGDPLNEANKTDSKWGGFMKEIDKFDALFFGISPREAELMDPQHRLFMQIVWRAVEDAGYRASDLSGTNTGVYVGITNRDYADVLEKHTSEIETQGVFGNIHPFLPNRISFLLNLHGPSEPIDTLCSSSLVAVHRAVEDIRHGNCQMAIAGGVSVIASPKMHIAFSKGKMLSNDGHCKTFDKSANGFVRGEGAGAIILKSLDQARADGDYIYAVIRGTGENHGGHSPSLTAPNAQAQANLLIHTYERAHISPGQVSYIETHGTGTILGDPVEMNGLKMAFQKMSEKKGLSLPDRPYCGLGSVKSNIGHLEAAAGIAGILKVLLAMKHQVLPASLHVDTQNPYIDITDSPFYIVNSTRRWERPLAPNGNEYSRIAGISSFGAGGVNAHVILEEYDNEWEESGEESQPASKNKRTGIDENGSQIIVLSAKNEASLMDYAKALLSCLERMEHGRVDKYRRLDSIAYTLQTGREPMEERLALMVGSLEELQTKLKSFCLGKREISNLYRGSAWDSAGPLGAYAVNGTEYDPGRIAEAWVLGTDFDWHLLYRHGTPMRIPLPAYPFKGERYWVEDHQNSKDSGLKENCHPLVRQNTSLIACTRFSTEFTGEEFFFTDHVVGDKKMFPGAAYIEMARAAGERAGECRISKMKNIIWIKPLTADSGKIRADICLRQSDEGVEFEVSSTGSDAGKTLHAQGMISYDIHSEDQTVKTMLDVHSIKDRCMDGRNKNDIYHDFTTRGFKYGSLFQPIQALWLSDRECLSYLKLPAGCIKDFDQFGLHPSLLDGALQTAVELLAVGREIHQKSYMPFSLEELVLLDSVWEQECYVHAVCADAMESGGQLKLFDIMIADKTGRVLAVLKKFGILSLKPKDASGVEGTGYYQAVWRKRLFTAGEMTGHVLLFDNQSGLKEVLQSDAAYQMILVRKGSHFRKMGKDTYEMNPYDRDDYEMLLKTLHSERMVPGTILHAWSLSQDRSDHGSLDQPIRNNFYTMLYLTQALIKLHLSDSMNLVYLYPGSVSSVKPEFAAVSALTRTIQIEYPNLACMTLGVDLETIHYDTEKLSEELLAGNVREPEVIYQSGIRYVKEFIEIDSAPESAVESLIREKGTYLITGGAGGLGMIFSEYLAKHHKANLILAGRSELKAEQKEKIAALSAPGLRVTYVTADVAKKENVRNLIAAAKAEFGSINGVIHAAGTIQDSFILKKTDQEAAQVIEPKVYGMVYLDELLAEEQLDFFAVFSSVSAVTGNMGQCDYAYANSFMDHYAIMREAMRLNGERYGKTISINWPLWRDGGMPVTAQTEIWMRNNMGMVPLDTESGVKVFKEGLKLGITDLIVMNGDPERIRKLANEKFLPGPVVKKASPHPAEQFVAGEESDGMDIKKAVIEYLKEMLSKITKLPVKSIKPNVSLEKYGIDSLMIVKLNQELERDFAKLSKTLFFEYQTIEELSCYFIESHRDEVLTICGLHEKNDRQSGPGITAAEMITTPERVKTMEREDIAIVGLSGTYPGAESLEQFWENLKAGKDAITQIPDERWDYRRYYDPDKNKPGKTYSKWGGFINDVDKFDPAFFNISPREAEFIDPQERLFLSTVWHTMEDAGYTRERISQNKVGVFAGVMYGQYQLFGRDADDGFVYGDSFYASIANRVSYLFNFHGPSISLDTMCSSSITAVHLACESIRRGECELAFAGGVNLSIHPNKYLFLSRGNYVSSDGRCRSFGEGGDGYVPGEGVGAVLLKPLSKAVKDGDHIYAVIKGTSINHGGKTNGYTVPNPNAQADVIRDTLSRSAINPRTVSYLEAHGTGTSLGDPIEITGLVKAYGGFTQDRQYCAIGSVKSNIGHLEAAAGIAALTKVLLQMKYKQLVPSIHADVLNPNINFDDSPFRVQREWMEWSKPVIAENGSRERYPRRAGISAFGAGGSNAHLILEEYEDERKEPVFSHPQMVILSAKSEERLLVYVGKLLAFLHQTPTLNIADVAFTLQVGREAMNERLSVLAADLNELISKLKQFQKGGERVEGLFRGNTKRDAPKLKNVIGDVDEEAYFMELMARKEYDRLLEIWAYGAEIDWMALYDSKNTLRRVSLPTYPFLKERYWISDCRERLYESDIRDAETAEKPHILIDSNISTLQEELFLSRFTGTDYFLADHVIGNRKILPGAVYLEMVRAAGELAAEKPVSSMRQVFFSRPLIVENLPVPVYTGLFPENDYVRYEITTRDGGDLRFKHSYGRMFFEEEGSKLTKPQVINIDHIKARCIHTVEKDEFYRNFEKKGIQYGASFRVVEELCYSREEVLSLIKLPQEFNQQFGLHPLAIDGAFQSAVILGDTDDVYLPYSMDEIEIWEPLADNMFYVYADAKEYTNGESDHQRVNILIVSQKGEGLVRIKNLLFKKSTAKKGTESVAAHADVLYFEREWKQWDVASPKEPELSGGSMVIFDRDSRIYDALAKKFQTEGKEVRDIFLVNPGSCYERQGSHVFMINVSREDDYRRLFEDLNKTQTLPDKILFMQSEEGPGYLNYNPDYVKSQLERSFYPLVTLTRVLTGRTAGNKFRLLYVYKGLENDPLHAGVSGFLKSVTQENRKYKGKTVGITFSNEAAVQSDRLISLLLPEFDEEDDSEVMIDYDTGDRLAARFKELMPEADNRPMLLKEQGVYVITGGMGALGFIFAEFLAKQVKAKLVLTGRSDLTEEKQKKIRELEALGSEVLYLKGDVFDQDDMEGVIKAAKHRFKAIHGMIHSAGVTRDSLISDKNQKEMKEVLAPKIFGSMVLDEVTKNEQLEFMVFFSSITGVMGNAGQSDYAYANSFMDHFAAYREKLRKIGLRHGKTISINWPLWADGGMTVNEQTRQLLTRTMGTDVLDKDTGLKAFTCALLKSGSQMLVMKGNPMRVRDKMGLTKAKQQAVTDRPGHEYRERMIQSIETELVKFISRVLKMKPEDIEMDEAFNHYGFDSVSITEMANLINEKYNLRITPANFYEHSTAKGFAQGLYDDYQEEFVRYDQEARNQIAGESMSWNGEKTGGSPSTTRFSVSTEPVMAADEPVAIVGIGGVMPQSGDLETFWKNLESGKDLITEIPEDRWNWKACYGDASEGGNKTMVKWGGFMSEIDKFDNELFGISPYEADLMDPQQRIFLETVWKTIEDAGYKVSDFSGTRTGVFVGVSNMDYYEVINEYQDEIEAHISTGNAHSMIANRVSFLMNIHGPSEPVNTACSSSLVAIHRAIEAIRNGSCDMAIAGGVNVIISPRLSISFDKAGMLSPDGRCKTFDKSADGYVRGEGAGAVLLKPLRSAEADGDHIYAVIKGSAVNHCGRTNSLTAPSPKAQADVIREAIEKAGINPAYITYLEAHGTGTSLGDPIEINGLKKVFAKLFEKQGDVLPKTPYCGIGAVKTNIGHLESAAGIAGLLKVILAMKHKTIPQNIHFNELNPYIDLKDSPFYIAANTTSWETMTDRNGLKVPRIAGVSSFGFGGVNAHVILEEYHSSERSEREMVSKGEYLFVLSAKNHKMLRVYTQKILSILSRISGPVKRDGGIRSYKKIGRDLSEMLAEILHINVSDVNVRDRYAEYGLDHITVSEFAGRINERFHTDIDLNTILAHDSLEMLAAYLFEKAGYGDHEECCENLHSEDDIFLADLCYTLQVGREPMKSRIAVTAAGTEELIQKLTLYTEGQTEVEGCYCNEVQDSKSDPDLLITGKQASGHINSLITNRQLSALARLWAYGANIDWSLLHKAGAHRRIPLQCYPFERKRFWVNSRGINIFKNPQPDIYENTGPVKENDKETKEKVGAVLAKILSIHKKELDENTEFAEMGLDSIMGIKLVKQLNKEFGIAMNPMIISNNPTWSSLATYITSCTGGQAAYKAGQSVQAEEEQKPPAESGRMEAVRNRLKGILSGILSIDVAEIKEDTIFADVGLDSILTIKLTKLLNKEFGAHINPVMIIENQTIHQLAELFAGLTG